MGEPVSQTKISIDFTGAGALGGASQQLKRVKSADEDTDRDTEVVTAIGVKGGAGFRDKEGGGGLELEVYRETGTPEVDWRALWNAKTIFALTFQDENGARTQFQSCRVTKVVRKDDDQGSHMDAVSVKFLRSVTL